MPVGDVLAYYVLQFGRVDVNEGGIGRALRDLLAGGGRGVQRFEQLEDSEAWLVDLALSEGLAGLPKQLSGHEEVGPSDGVVKCALLFFTFVVRLAGSGGSGFCRGDGGGRKVYGRTGASSCILCPLFVEPVDLGVETIHFFPAGAAVCFAEALLGHGKED